MSKTKCGNCARLTAAGFLCPDCQAKVLRVLWGAADMIGQLDLVLTRQTRFSAGSAVRSTAETAVDFSPTASKVSAKYRHKILQWQARLADHLNPNTVPATVQTPYRLAEPIRFLNPVKAAVWMHERISERGVARWADAGKMTSDLIAAHKKAIKVIDHPVDRWYAGQCGDWHIPEGADQAIQCEQDLYADDENATMKCPRCGAEHVVWQRRDTLLAEAEESLLTAVEAAKAVTVWSDYDRGENNLAHNIVVWASRGRLEAKGTRYADGKERPTYLLKDIRGLIAEYEARIAERKRKAKA